MVFQQLFPDHLWDCNAEPVQRPYLRFLSKIIACMESTLGSDKGNDQNVFMKQAGIQAMANKPTTQPAS